MKNAYFLKNIINLLFGIYSITLFLFIIFSLFDFGEITFDGNYQNKWIIFIQFVPTVLFLFGLWFLRKVSIQYIKNKNVTFLTHKSIKKAGAFFIMAGIVKITLSILLWVQNLTNKDISFSTGSETTLTFILLIVGLFMLLQSKTLVLAKEYEDEINLTI